MLLTTMECGKPKSKYYAKASVWQCCVGIRSFDYQKNSVIKTLVLWDYEQSLLILHRQEGKKKKDIFTNFLNAPKYANLSTQFHRLQVNIFGF